MRSIVVSELNRLVGAELRCECRQRVASSPPIRVPSVWFAPVVWRERRNSGVESGSSFDDEEVVNEMPFFSGLELDHFSNRWNITKPGVFLRFGFECGSVNKITVVGFYCFSLAKPISGLLITTHPAVVSNSDFHSNILK